MMKYLDIKKLSLAIIATLMLNVAVMAQAQDDNRTLGTQIADLLVQFPATDAKDLNRLMNETAALGEEGILSMAEMFVPPAKGENANLEYALGGLSFYVMQEKNEALRVATSKAFSKAADQVKIPEVKVFFIKQLQWIGKDEAVMGIEKYLSEERFCGPAARALVSIKTPAAQEALLNALSGADGNCQYALIEALGDVRNKAAVDALTELVNDKDVKTNKLSLYALANIGDPVSGDLLAAQAGDAGYKLNETNASAAYLLWIKRMAEAGNNKEVVKLTKGLLKKLDQKGQVHTRTAFLKLYVDVAGKDAIKELVKAATSDDPEFRAAALKFAAEFDGDDITREWLKQIKKADPEVKAELITFLGATGNKKAYDAVAQALENENDEVKLAAIKASAKIDPEKALPQLLKIINTASQEEIDAVKISLLTMKGDITSQVADALPQASQAAGKAALLDVLAARKATEYSAAVLALVNDQDAVVRSAAIKALQDVSSQDDLSALYKLLGSAKNDDEVRLIQVAIINAVDAGDKSGNAAGVMAEMEKAAPDKKHLYYNILSSIGGDDALNAIVKEYHDGNAVAKKAAINALSDWKGSSAARELLKIARASTDSQHFNQLLNAYVSQVKNGDYTDQNKYLLFREAMPIAKTTDQKKMILRQIGESKTFSALIYAGQFLDKEELKSVAANSVLNIALENDQFYGDKVRELLEKTLNSLEGQESSYQKQSLKDHLSKLPEGPGLVPLFNEEDLTGWKGLVENPIKRAGMSAKQLASAQAKADASMRDSWIVEDGKLIFTGKGHNISTAKKYGDFEMYVDWKIYKDGDAGIYLRGTPQVQIWDTARREAGAQVGSGGLYNNKTYESKPLKVADNPVGEWNTFRIIMKGEYVTVFLNGELVVDNVIMENYWDRDQPIFGEDYIELQAHGNRIEYRDIFIREIPKAEPFVLSKEEKEEGFEVLFDGTNMHNWQGNKTDYTIEDGDMVIRPKRGSRGNLFTKEQYSDFVFRFEFQLTPGANNGLGIRAPLNENAAYQGMELQILDNTADIYKNLQEYQYHGSVYGVIAAKRGYLKPVGEWNYQEVVVNGSHVKVILNGNVILDGDIIEASKNGTRDGKKHPGLNNETGHIGFLGHGSVVKFRNIRIKQLDTSRM